jgi:hypothetical protein
MFEKFFILDSVYATFVSGFRIDMRVCATHSLCGFPILQSLLRRLGYTREISHGVLMAMVEHRHELEAKTKPILDTLRSYQDLPPVIILQSCCPCPFMIWFSTTRCCYKCMANPV